MKKLTGLSDEELRIMKGSPKIREHLKKKGFGARYASSFEALDEQLLRLLTVRDQLSAELGRFKFVMGLRIRRQQVERMRIKRARRIAKALGHSNPDMVARVMEVIIVDSRMAQEALVKRLQGTKQIPLKKSNSDKKK